MLMVVEIPNFLLMRSRESVKILDLFIEFAIFFLLVEFENMILF